MIYGNTVGGSGGSGIGKTFIIEDEAGNQLVGIVTDRPVTFDAGPNDIRLGKTAATQNGVTVGEKVIPSYNTTEGYAVVTAGNRVRIAGLIDCEYTKLQALICAFNSSIPNSVATEKVCIENSVYPVGSTVASAKVTTNTEDQAIDFGITNDSGSIQIIRYFMYKEVY